MTARSICRFTRAAIIVTAAGCAAGTRAHPPTLGALPFMVSSTSTQHVTDGVWREVIRSPTGPWTINALFVDLDRCNFVQAVKGSDSATGRFKVTDMLRALRARELVVAGV